MRSEKKEFGWPEIGAKNDDEIKRGKRRGCRIDEKPQF